jgi:ATP-dependent Clp protease ATP-binding subunit ClpA
MKETFETNIRDPIVEQLKYCPRSVIVLDDIQHAHVGLIEELKSALDTTALINCPQHLCPPSQPNLSTKSAIFILASDLEPDHAKRLLTGDLTKKEAIKVIQELADNRWGGRSQGSKMMKLLTVVPFLPLTGYDLHNILLRKIKDFEEKIRTQLQLEVSTKHLPYNVQWLGRVWPVKGTEERILELMDPTLGARVVDSYLRQHAYFFIDPIVEELLELSRTPADIKDAALPFAKIDFLHALGKFTKPTHLVLHDVQVRLEDKELTMELVQSVDSNDQDGNHNEDL